MAAYLGTVTLFHRGLAARSGTVTLAHCVPTGRRIDLTRGMFGVSDINALCAHRAVERFDLVWVNRPVDTLTAPSS